MKIGEKLERIIGASEGGSDPSSERARARWSALTARLFGRGRGAVSPEFTARVMMRVLAEPEPAHGSFRRWMVPGLGLAAAAAAAYIFVSLTAVSPESRPAEDLSTTAILVSQAQEEDAADWVFHEEAAQPEELLASMVEVNYEE